MTRHEPETPDEPGHFIRWLIAQPRYCKLSVWLDEARDLDSRGAAEGNPYLRRIWRGDAASRRFWAAVIFSARSIRIYQTGAA